MTNDEWFEVQGYIKGGSGPEQSIAQNVCGGSAGGSAPFSSLHHLAKCGYINVFHWSEGRCAILNF